MPRSRKYCKKSCCKTKKSNSRTGRSISRNKKWRKSRDHPLEYKSACKRECDFETEICNKKTGNCVSRQGKIGKKIIRSTIRKMRSKFRSRIIAGRETAIARGAKLKLKPF